MYNKVRDVEDCSSLLQFVECEFDGYKELVRANYCHDFLCPTCNEKRSELLSYQISQIILEVEKLDDYKYIFLTLIVPNIKGKHLSKTYDDISKGFVRLFNCKNVDDICVGFVGNLRTTIKLDKNLENCITYYPCLHILIAVKSTYFKDKTYIGQEEWVKLWREAMKINYNPIVYVKEVKSRSKGKDDLLEVINEVSKYSVEGMEYLYCGEDVTDKLVKTLFYALKGRCLVRFSKLFEEIRAELKFQDIEDKDTDFINYVEHKNHCPMCGGILHNTIYGWIPEKGNYYKLDLTLDKMNELFNSLS